MEEILECQLLIRDRALQHFLQLTKLSPAAGRGFVGRMLCGTELTLSFRTRIAPKTSSSDSYEFLLAGNDQSFDAAVERAAHG